MWAKLSDTRVFHLYSAAGLTNLTLTIVDEDGTAITDSPFTPTELTAATIPFLYSSGDVTFPSEGRYDFTWAADGYTHWESVSVVETPPADATPSVTTKFVTGLSGLATPRVFILDEDGEDVTDCVVSATRVVVTGTVDGPFVFGSDVDFTVTFETSASQDVTIPAGSYTVAEALESINNQIVGGRAVASGSKVQIQTDQLGVGGQIVLAGSDLTSLGMTAATTTYAFTDTPVALSVLVAGESYGMTYGVQLDEGVYTLLWCDASVVQDWETVMVHTPPDLPYVLLTLSDTSGTGIPGASLVILDSLDAIVDQGVTDPQGRVATALPPGDYTIIVERSGYVFTSNGFSISVTDRWDSGFTNNYVLLSDHVRAPFNYVPVTTPSDFSTMSAQLVDIRGRPLCGISILISTDHVPAVTTNSGGERIGVFGPPTKAVTDSAGRIEVPLLKGIDVSVAVEATSVRRRFTVPSTATFNLLDYFTTSDVFDIVRIVVNNAAQEDL